MGTEAGAGDIAADFLEGAAKPEDSGGKSAAGETASAGSRCWPQKASLERRV